MELNWERESVCMADDCTAPNPRTEHVEGPLTALRLLELAAGYVPKVRGGVWAVWAEERLIGFLEYDAGRLRPEPEEGVPVFSDSLQLYCAYYTEGRFRYRMGRDGPLVEEYPESPRLLDKAKRCARERGPYGWLLPG